MALFGELENAVMNFLWAQGKPLRVRDVHEALAADRELAYTTVLTVLDRLWKKGEVTRSQADGERAWLYQPARGRAEAYADAVLELLRDAGDDAARAIAIVRSKSEL